MEKIKAWLTRQFQSLQNRRSQYKKLSKAFHRLSDTRPIPLGKFHPGIGNDVVCHFNDEILIHQKTALFWSLARTKVSDFYTDFQTLNEEKFRKHLKNNESFINLHMYYTGDGYKIFGIKYQLKNACTYIDGGKPMGRKKARKIELDKILENQRHSFAFQDAVDMIQTIHKVQTLTPRF